MEKKWSKLPEAKVFGLLKKEILDNDEFYHQINTCERILRCLRESWYMQWRTMKNIYFIVFLISDMFVGYDKWFIFKINKGEQM